MLVRMPPVRGDLLPNIDGPCNLLSASGSRPLCRQQVEPRRPGAAGRYPRPSGSLRQSTRCVEHRRMHGAVPRRSAPCVLRRPCRQGHWTPRYSPDADRVGTPKPCPSRWRLRAFASAIRRAAAGPAALAWHAAAVVTRSGFCPIQGASIRDSAIGHAYARGVLRQA